MAGSGEGPSKVAERLEALGAEVVPFAEIGT